MVAAVLDHVAVAADRIDDLLPRYAGDLAGEWVGGGWSVGFAINQVQFAGGMKVEVIQPNRVEENDFLRRFLDRSGPGPHHLTFKVPDIEAALDQAGQLGFEPVSIDLSDPEWKEAFLHPKQACGIVVQLAESSGEFEPPDPPELPEPRVPQPAQLVEVVLAVADPAAAAPVFEDLLGGQVDPIADHPTHRRISWPGGGHLRIVTVDADQLEGRPGRLTHLTFRTIDPASVRGATPAGDGTYRVEAADNLGTRLVLVPPAG